MDKESLKKLVIVPMLLSATACRRLAFPDHSPLETMCKTREDICNCMRILKKQAIVERCPYSSGHLDGDCCWRLVRNFLLCGLRFEAEDGIRATVAGHEIHRVTRFRDHCTCSNNDGSEHMRQYPSQAVKQNISLLMTCTCEGRHAVRQVMHRNTHFAGQWWVREYTMIHEPRMTCADFGAPCPVTDGTPEVPSITDPIERSVTQPIGQYGTFTIYSGPVVPPSEPVMPSSLYPTMSGALDPVEYYRNIGTPPDSTNHAGRTLQVSRDQSNPFDTDDSDIVEDSYPPDQLREVIEISDESSSENSFCIQSPTPMAVEISEDSSSDGSSGVRRPMRVQKRNKQRGSDPAVLAQIAGLSKEDIEHNLQMFRH